MENLKLSDVFQSEQAEDWKQAADQYVSLYTVTPTNKVAMHYAFFCWYLLWQWDEICFPGEETISLYERPNADTRNGISKSGLFSQLNLTTKQLLTASDTPVKYLVILAHMEKIYPYFFQKDTFSETDRKQIVEAVGKAPFEELGVRVIYQYVQTQDASHLTKEEKAAVHDLFPSNSLMQTYFTWLFS